MSRQKKVPVLLKKVLHYEAALPQLQLVKVTLFKINPAIMK
jgi:hypothetical protein